MGDYFAKAWSIQRDAKLIPLALAGYLLSGVFYIPTLLKEGLVITSIMWSLLSIIGFLIIGVVLFHEPLTTPQIVGITLGSLALIILSIY